MYLGLDLGTSALKALLIAEDQQPLASASAPLSVTRPYPGWSEQEPGTWIDAARVAIANLNVPLDGVAGIGLSGQMHGAVVLDKNDAPLRPCILWNDTRAHVEADALDTELFRARTGNIVFPGFTAPKLAWLRRHEPDIYRQTRKILLPKDYLRLWLTGQYVSDMSDASGTSWLNMGARTWDTDLLGAMDLGPEHMPDLVEGPDVSGRLRGDLAAELGLPAGIPVAGGAGDNAASAVGVGVARSGEAFVSLGTSGVLFAAADSYAPNAGSALHTFCHALPGRWHQMGVILAASDALAWYGRLVGADPADLTRELGALEAPGRALFLPYLGGERTPHNDPEIRGSLIGLEHVTDRRAGTRAVLEGVVHAFRDSLDAMRVTGTAPDRVIALGGGAKASYWLKALATGLNLPVDVPVGGEFGAAFGAARLGMMAASGAGPEILTAPKIARSLEPVPDLVDAFDAAHARYRSTYGALKPLS